MEHSLLHFENYSSIKDVSLPSYVFRYLYNNVVSDLSITAAELGGFILLNQATFSV